MKKQLTLVLALSLLLVFAACGTKNDPPLQHEETATVKVEIIAEDGTAVLPLTDTEVTALNAEEAIVTACRENAVTYTLKDGFFSAFADTPTNKTDGWLLYINDELAQKGASDSVLKENDVVSFRFVNFDEAFK